jgi:hypothetical protein
VSFRIVSEEVLNAPVDEAEFGLRLQLKFVTLRRHGPFHTLDQLVIELGRIGLQPISNQVKGGQRQLLAPRSWPVFAVISGSARCWRPLDVPRALVQSHGLCRKSMVPTGDNRPFLLQFQFFGHTR